MSNIFPFDPVDYGQEVEDNPEFSAQLPSLDSIQESPEIMPDGSKVFVVGDNAGEEKSLPVDNDFYRNLAEDLDRKILNSLASKLLEDIKNDRDSRKDWESSVNLAITYLGFKVEEFRNVPFLRACAAYDTTLAVTLMNFFASARAELFPPSGPAKCEVEGVPTPEMEERGERVSMFLNYFLTKIDRAYYSDSDKLIMYVGLFGSGFRKVVMDPMKDMPSLRLVKPQNLIIDNNGTNTTLLESTRITEETFLTRREYLIRQKEGIFLEYPLPEVSDDNDDMESSIDKKIRRTEGIQDGQSENKSMFKVYECHVELSPDQVEDEFQAKTVKKRKKYSNIPRPYIIEICEATRKICSIRRNWKERDDKFNRKECYVHYYYLPGFGIYSQGLAHIIGSNAIVLTDVLRQQIDAGTLKNFPGGLKTKTAKAEDNNINPGPASFREIDTGGAPLAESIMLMPYAEPSQVLAQLRGELRDETMSLGGASQQGVDNIGANTPVGTILAQLEVQNRIPSTILKSLYAAQAYELTLLKELFAEYFSDEPYPFKVPGKEMTIMKEDFSDNVNIVPVSDPNILTTTHRIIVAEILLKMAQSAPELHDMREAFNRMYTAMNVQNIDQILPPPQEVQPADPVTENVNMMNGKPVKAAIWQNHPAHKSVHEIEMKKLPPEKQDVAASMAAHISEHEAFTYLLEMQTLMGMQMPDEKQLEDHDVQNHIAMVAAQAAQKKAEEDAKKQAEQNPPPLDPNQVMMADIEQRREASMLKHEEAQLKAETEAFKSQLKFESDKARMENEKDIAEEKNETSLILAEVKHQPNSED